MKRISIPIIFVFFSHFSFSLDISQVAEIKEWRVLQEEPVWIGLTNISGFPICKATTTMPYSLESISAIIENVNNYTNVFLRLTESRLIETDIMYVIVDMPFPFSPRDYIVKYTKDKTDSNWVFRFSSIKHPDVPTNKNNVRLINAAGEWKLNLLSQNRTLVTYIWNGELRGDFPEWALTKAWITQGDEMMVWLNDALK